MNVQGPIDFSPELWPGYVRQLSLAAWSFAANFATGMALYLTRETGLLRWALDSQQLQPGAGSSFLLIGGGIAFGSVLLAVTARFSDRLLRLPHYGLFIFLGAWTLLFLVRPNAVAWLAEDAGYEAYASTWFFVGWAITQFAAAWLLVDSDGDDAATSPA